MLAFTFRMIIADIQKAFKSFWIIIYIGLLTGLIIIPYYGNFVYPFSYVIFIVFSVLEPHISKVFYVLPLGSKLLRRYLHLRSLLLAMFFLVVGGVVVLSSQVLNVSYIEKGWLMTMLYIQLSLLLSITHTGIIMRKNNVYKNIVLGCLIIMLVGSAINAIILVNFKLQLIISIIYVLIYEALLIIGLRKVDLSNYVEPRYYGLLSNVWKAQKKQIATSDMKGQGKI